MKKYPELNFPKHPQRVTRDRCGGMRIWDSVRGSWLVLTPEEWVRRHTVEYLIRDARVPGTHIRQEYPVCISGMPQRADIVVMGKEGRPVMLVECKAPEVAIDNTVYGQAVRYNAVIGAPYIMLTNGLSHYVFENDGEGNYIEFSGLPDLEGYWPAGR